MVFSQKQFELRDRKADWFYWVLDGINSNFHIFFKTIASLKCLCDELFAKSQEAYWKGSERAFAVLFIHWHILSIKLRIWYNADMYFFVKTCVVLLNMIFEIRDNDTMDGFGTKVLQALKITSVRNRAHSIPATQYAHAVYLSTIADRVEDRYYQEMLQNALKDAIWVSCAHVLLWPLKWHLIQILNDEGFDGLHDKKRESCARATPQFPLHPPKPKHRWSTWRFFSDALVFRLLFDNPLFLQYLPQTATTEGIVVLHALSAIVIELHPHALHLHLAWCKRISLAFNSNFLWE